MQNKFSGKFRKIPMKTSVLESLFNKVASLTPTDLLKKDPAQLFSCEFCK